MKILTNLALLVSIGCLAACGGGAESADDSQVASAASGAEPIGPATEPNMTEQPLEFLHWRIDRMWEDFDTNGDGLLSLEEFTVEDMGQPYAFERIDANADGFLTKQEIVDDQEPVLREEGKID